MIAAVGKVWRSLPAGIKRSIWFAVFGSLDVLDVILRRRDPMVPPRRIQYVGLGGFKQIGANWLRLLIHPGGLRPDDRVLEVGCGPGRIAIPLAEYLSPKGSYEGLDITEEQILWCQKHISSRYRNFKFRKADLFNKVFNPRGTAKASEYRFPYEDEEFDLVLLASVFTHMLPGDVSHYMSEIARLLKPGGTSIATYFLLNEESVRLINQKKSIIPFPHAYGPHRTVNLSAPETDLAFAETFIRESYAQNGLNIRSVHYGRWSGRADPDTYDAYQDLVIAVKGAPSGSPDGATHPNVLSHE